MSLSKKILAPFQLGQKDVEILKQTSLYSGFYQYMCYQFRHRLFNGGKSASVSREVVIRPSAVAVLCYDALRDKVVLIEQIRIGPLLQDIESCSPWLLEIVAGLREPQETDEMVARREALEEAGVEIGRLQKILNYFPSPGCSNEILTLMVAETDSSQAFGVHGVHNENEDILVHVVSRQQAYEWIATGNIINASAIIALQWLQNNHTLLQQQWA